MQFYEKGRAIKIAKLIVNFRWSNYSTIVKLTKYIFYNFEAELVFHGVISPAGGVISLPLP